MRQETAPEVAIEQLSGQPEQHPGLWALVWVVRNVSRHPLRLLRGRLPHNLFYSRERELKPPLALEPGASGPLEFAVACREPHGAIVENAFLILQAAWLGQNWWIFARLRVVVENCGPRTTTENVAIYPVGFSR